MLSFVQNKIDVMDEESLVRICSTSFTLEDVSMAKKLLFESAPSSKRKVNRRGTAKTERDLFDIITLLKETDPEAVPVFVARELHKLPPVTFDHLDATRLLKDLLILQREINHIKENYVTKEEFVSMKNNTKSFENLSSNITDSHVTTQALANNSVELCPSLSREQNARKEKDVLLDHTSKSRTSPLIHVEAPTATSVSTATERPTAGLKHVEAHATALAHVEARIDVSNSEITQVYEPTHSNSAVCGDGKGTYAQLLSTPKKTNDVYENIRKDKNDWILVEKKKRFKEKFIGIRGRANTDDGYGKFRAASIRIPLFINNVDKSTTANDIHTYILEKTQINVFVEKIQMKKQKDYDAYKIFVPKHKLLVFLDDSLWPEGVTFRRFVEIQKQDTKNGSQKS